MDITFGKSDIVEQNNNILIHLFFHLVNFDVRQGFFSDESSIRDMGTCGFTENDYEILAKQYYDNCPQDYSYSEGQKFYLHLCHDRFDNMIVEKFEATYGFPIDKKIHYLKDFILLLKEKFPNRDWDRDNIFIIKTLDNILEKEELLVKEEVDSELTNVIRLPVKKKKTVEEIKSGTNDYLMVKELGLTWQEARVLAQENFDKKMLGKKFEPYIPGKKSKCHKMK